MTNPDEFEFQHPNAFRAAVNVLRIDEVYRGGNPAKKEYAEKARSDLIRNFTKEEGEEYLNWVKNHYSFLNPKMPKLARFSSSPPPAFVSPDPTTGIHSSVPPSSSPVLTPPAGGNSAPPPPAFGSGGSSGGSGQPPVSPPPPLLPPNPGNSSGSGSGPRKLRINQAVNHKHLSAVERDILDRVNQQIGPNFEARIVLRPSSTRVEVGSEKKDEKYSAPGFNKMIDTSAVRNLREKVLVITEVNSDGRPQRTPTYFKIETSNVMGPDLRTGNLSAHHDLVAVQNVVMVPTMILNDTTRGALPTIADARSTKTGDRYLSSADVAVRTIVGSIKHQSNSTIHDRFNELTQHFPTISPDYRGLTQLAGPHLDPNQRKMAAGLTSYVSFERGPHMQQSAFEKLTSPEWMSESGYMEGASASTHAGYTARERRHVSSKDVVLAINAAANMQGGMRGTVSLGFDNEGNPLTYTSMKIDEDKYAKKSQDDRLKYAAGQIHKREAVAQRQGIIPFNTSPLVSSQYRENIGFVPQEGFAGVLMLGSKVMSPGGVDESGNPLPEYAAQIDPVGSGGMVGSTDAYRMRGNASFADEVNVMPKSANIRDLRIVAGRRSIIPASGGTVATWGKNVDSGEVMESRMPSMGNRGGVRVTGHILSFGNDELSARHIRDLLQDPEWTVEKIHRLIKDPSSTVRGTENFSKRIEIEKRAIDALNKIQRQDIQDRYAAIDRTGLSPQEIADLEKEKQREIRGSIIKYDKKAVGGKRAGTALISSTSYIQLPDSMKGGGFKAMLGHVETDPRSRQILKSLIGNRNPEEITEKEINEVILPRFVSEMGLREGRSQHLSDEALQSLVGNQVKNILFGRGWQEMRTQQDMQEIDQRNISDAQKNRLKSIVKKKTRAPLVPVLTMTHDEIKYTRDLHLRTLLTYMQHSAPDSAIGAGKAPNSEFARHVEAMGRMIRAEYATPESKATGMDLEREIEENIRSLGGTQQEAEQAFERRYKAFANIVDNAMDYGGRPWILTSFPHVNAEPMGTTNMVNAPFMRALLKSAPELRDYLRKNSTAARNISQMLAPEAWGKDEIVDVEAEDLKHLIPSTAASDEYERFEAVKRIYDSARKRENKTKDAAMRLTVGVDADGNKKQIVLASPHAFASLERSDPGTTFTRIVEKVQNPGSRASGTSTIDELENIHRKAVQQYAQSDAGQKNMQNFSGGGLNAMALRYISSPSASPGKVLVGKQDIESVASGFGLTAKALVKRMRAGQKFHVYVQRYPQSEGSGAWYELEYRKDYKGAVAVPTEANSQFAGDDDGDLANFMAGFRGVTYKKDGKWHNEFVPLPGVESAVIEQGSPKLTALNRFASFYGFRELGSRVKEARLIVEKYMKDELEHTQEFQDHLAAQYGKIDAAKDPETYRRAFETERDRRTVDALVSGFNFVSDATNRGYHVSKLNLEFAGKEQNTQLDAETKMIPVRPGENKSVRSRILANALGQQAIAVKPQILAQQSAEEGAAKRDMGIYTIVKNLQYTAETPEHLAAIEKASFNLYGENLLAQLGESIRPHENPYASSSSQALSNLDWVYQRALDMLPKHQQTKDFAKSFFVSDINTTEDLFERKRMTEELLSAFLQSEEVTPIAIGASFARRGNAEQIEKITSIAEDIKREIAQKRESGKQVTHKDLMSDARFRGIIEGRGYDTTAYAPDADSPVVATITQQAYINTIARINKDGYENLNLDQKKKINEALQQHRERIRTQPGTFRRDWEIVSSMSREKDPTGFWSQAVQAAGGLKNLENMDPITLANALGIKVEIPETENPRNNQTNRRIADLDKLIQDPVGEFARMTGIYSGSINDKISLDEERQSLYRQAMGSPEQALPGGIIVEGPQRGFNARASSIESITSFPDSPAHQDRAKYRMGGSGANVYKTGSVFEVINQMAVDLLAGNRKNTIHFRDSDLPHGMNVLSLGKNEYTMLQQTNRAMRSGNTYEEELKKMMQEWNLPNSSAAFLHMSGFGLSAVEEQSRVFFSGTPDFFKASWKPVTDDKGNVIDRQFSLSVYDAKSTSLGKALKNLGFSIDDVNNISEDKIRNAGNSADFGVYSGQLSSYVFLAKEMAKEMRDEAGRAVVRAKLKGMKPDTPPPPSEIEDPATGETQDQYKFTGSFDELDINGINVNSRYAKHINQLTEMLQEQNVNLVDKDGSAMTHRQIAINMMEAMAAGRIEEGGVIIKNDKNVINTGVINSSASSDLRVQTMFKGAQMVLSSRRLPATGDKSVRSMLRKFPEKARKMAASESSLAALGFMYHAVGIAAMNKNELLGRNRETGEPESVKNYADISPLFGVLRESTGKDPLTIARAASAPSMFDDENEPLTSSGYAKRWTTEDEEADETASVLATMMQHSQLDARQIASMEYILRGFARKTNRLGDTSVQREGNAVVGRDARGIRGGFKYLFDNTDREYVAYKNASGKNEMADDITLREAVIGASADFSGDGKTAFISSAIEDRYMMPDGTRTNKLSYVATNVRDAINPHSSSADNETNLSERFAAQAGAIERLYKVAGILDEDEYKTLTRLDNPSPSGVALQELIHGRSLSLQQRLMDRHRSNYESIGESSISFDSGNMVGYDRKTGQIGIRDEYDENKVTAFRLNSRMFSIGGMMESAQTVITRMAFASLQNMKAVEKGRPYWTRDLDKRDSRQTITAEAMYAMLNPDSDKSRQKSAYEVAMRRQGFGARLKELAKSFVSREKHVYKSKDFAQMPKGGAGVNDTDFWFQTPVVNQYSGVSAFKTSPDHRSWFYTHHLKPMHAIVKGLMKEGVRSGQWKKEDVDEEIVMGMLITHDLMKARTTRKDIAKKAQEEKEGRKYDPEEDKSPAAEMLKSMGISEEKANRVAKYLTLMDSVKDPEWWKDVVDKDGKVSMTSEEKVKALPPEVRLMSTTDAMSHRTGGVHGFLNIFSRITNLIKDKSSTLQEIVESNAKKSKKDSRKILMDVGVRKRDKVMEDAREAYDPVRRETFVSGFATKYVHGLIEKFGDEETRSLFDLAKNAFGDKSRFSTIDPKTGEMQPFDHKGKMHGGRIRKDDIDIVGEVEKESVFSKENGEMIVEPNANKGKKETVGEFGQEIISPGEDGELYVAPNSAIKRRDSEQYQSSVRSEQDKAFQNSKMWRPNRAGPGGRNKIFDIDQEISMYGWGKFGFLVPFGGFRSASERMLNIRVNESGDDELDYMDLVWRSFYKGQKKTGGNAIDVAKKYFGNMVSGIAFSHEIPDFEIEERNDGSWSGGWKKDDKENFVFDQDGKKVQEHNILVKSGNLNSLDALFTTFHEIGHFSRWKREGHGEGSEKKIRDWRLAGRRNDYARVLHDEASASLYALKHLKRILSKDQFSDAQQIAVTSLLSYEKTYPGFVLPDKIKTKHSPRVIPVWKPNSKIMEQIHGSNWLSDGFFENSEGKKTSKSIYRGWMPGSDYGFYTKKQIEETFSKYGYARAQGGPVDSGSSYFVGENEAELYNSAGLNRMNRPKAHEPEFGNPLSMGWATVAGYRASANKNSVRDGAGWKLHLAAKKENYAAVDKWLWHNSPYHYKLLAGGTPQESDFTIYAGAKDRATAMAKKIKSSLSSLLLFPGRAASKFGSDRLVNEVVSMRFDPIELPGQGGEAAMGETWFYGRNGIPYDIRGNQIASRYARLKLGIGMPKGSAEELLSLEKEMDAYDVEQEKYLAEKFPGIYDSLVEKINKTKAANALWSRAHGGPVEEGKSYVAGENAEETYESTYWDEPEKPDEKGLEEKTQKEQYEKIGFGNFQSVSERLLSRKAPLISSSVSFGNVGGMIDYLRSGLSTTDLNFDVSEFIQDFVGKRTEPGKKRLPVIYGRSSGSYLPKIHFPASLSLLRYKEYRENPAIWLPAKENNLRLLTTFLHEYGHHVHYTEADRAGKRISRGTFYSTMRNEAYANRYAMDQVSLLVNKGILSKDDKEKSFDAYLAYLFSYEHGLKKRDKKGYLSLAKDNFKRLLNFSNNDFTGRAHGGPVKESGFYVVGENDEEFYKKDGFSRANGGSVSSESGKEVGFIEPITPHRALINSSEKTDKEIVGEFGQEIISPGENGELYSVPNSAVRREDSEQMKANRRARDNEGFARARGGFFGKIGALVGEAGKEIAYESTSEGYTGNHFERLNKTYQKFYDSLYEESEDEIKIGLNKTESEKSLRKTASFIDFPRRRGDERPLNYRLWRRQNYKKGEVNPGFSSDIISVVKSKFNEFGVDLPEIEYRDLSSIHADGIYNPRHLDKGSVYIHNKFSKKPSIYGLFTTLHELGHYWDFARHRFDWEDPYVSKRDAENVYKKEVRANASAIFNARYFLKDKKHLAAFDQNALEALIEYEKHLDSYVKNGYSWKGVARASGGPVESGSSYVAGELAKETYKGPAVSREGGWVKEDGIERWDPIIGDVRPISLQEYMRAWKQSEIGFATTEDQGIALRRGPRNRYEDSSSEWNKAGYFRFWDPLRAVGEVAGIGARRFGALASVPIGFGVGFGIGAFNFFKGIRFSMPQGKGFRLPKISLPDFSFRLPEWSGAETGFDKGNKREFSFSLPKIKFPEFNFFPGPDQDKRALHRGMLQDSWDLSMERDRRKAELAQNWASQVEGIGAPYDEELMKSQDEELKNLNSYVDISPYLRERYKDYRRSSGKKQDGVVSSILETINRGLKPGARYGEEDIRGFMEVERWKRGGARTGLIGGLVGIGQNAARDFAVDAVDFAKSVPDLTRRVAGFARKGIDSIGNAFSSLRERVGERIESFSSGINAASSRIFERISGVAGSAMEAGRRALGTAESVFGTAQDFVGSLVKGYSARLGVGTENRGLIGVLEDGSQAIKERSLRIASFASEKGSQFLQAGQEFVQDRLGDLRRSEAGRFVRSAISDVIGLGNRVDASVSASVRPFLENARYQLKSAREQVLDGIQNRIGIIQKGVEDFPVVAPLIASVFAKKISRDVYRSPLARGLRSARSEVIGLSNRAIASANASFNAFLITSRIPSRARSAADFFERAGRGILRAKTNVAEGIRGGIQSADSAVRATAQNIWYGNDYPNGKEETVEGFLKVNKALEEARERKVEISYAAGDESGTRVHQVGQHDDAVQSLDRISDYGYATDGDIDQAMEAIQNSPSMRDAGITREDVRGYFNARAIQSRGGLRQGGLRGVLRAAENYTRQDIQAAKDFGSRAYQAAASFGDRALNTALVPVNGAINRIARGEAPTFQDTTEYLSNKEWFDASDESDLPSHIKNAQRYFAGKTGLIGAARTAAQSARSLLSRGASFVAQAAGRIFPVDDEAPGTLYGPEDGEQGFGARLERGMQKLLWGEDTVREWRPGASYGQRGGETFADRYQEGGGFSGVLGTLYNAKESFASSMFGNKGFMEYFMGIDIVKKGVNAAKTAAFSAIGAARIAGKKVMDSAIGRPLRAVAGVFDRAVFEAKGVYSGVMGKKTYTRFGKGIHSLRRRFGLKNEGDYRINRKRGETKISAIERVLGTKGVALKDATSEQMDWARTVLGRGGDPDTPFPESRPAAPAAAISSEADKTDKRETAEEDAAKSLDLLDEEVPETRVDVMDDEKTSAKSVSAGPDKTDASASEEESAGDKAMQELLERMFPDGSLGTVFSGQFGGDGSEAKTDVARIVRAQLFGTMKTAMKMGGGMGGLLGGMFGGSRKGATGKWKFSPAAMRRLFTRTVKNDKGVETVVARDDFADAGGLLKLPGWNNEEITKMLGSREIGTKEAEGISHMQAISSRGHRATMENFDQGVKFLEAELAQSAPGSAENEGIANALKTVRNMRNAKMIMGGRTSATTMSGLTHDEVIQKAKDINASVQAGDHTADFKKNMKAFTDELIKGSQVMKGLNDNIDKLTATTKSAYETVKSVAETRDQMKQHADTLEKAGYGATKEGREAIALAREKQYEAQAQLNKGSDLYESIKSKHGEKEAVSLFDEFGSPASRRTSKWRDPMVAAMSAHFVREFSFAARESFGQLQYRALLGAQQEEQERSRLAFVGESIGSQFDPGTRYAGMKRNWDRGMNKDAANLLGAVQGFAGDTSFSGFRAAAQIAEPVTSAGMLMATLNQSGIAKIGSNVALPIMGLVGAASIATNIIGAANNPWAMASARAMKDAGGNPYSSSAWEGVAFTMTGDRGADTEWYKQEYQAALSKENEIKKAIAEQQKIVDSSAGKELSDKEKSQIESLFKKRDIYKSQLGQGSTQYINTVQEIDDLLGKSGGAQAAYIAKNKIAGLEKQLEKAAENTYEARTNLNVSGVAAFAATEATPLFQRMPGFDKAQDVDSLESGKTISPAGMRMFADLASREGSPSDFRRYAFERGVVDTGKQIEAMQVAQIYAGRSIGPKYSAYYQAAIDRTSLGENLDETMGAVRRLGKAMGTPGFLGGGRYFADQTIAGTLLTPAQMYDATENAEGMNAAAIAAQISTYTGVPGKKISKNLEKSVFVGAMDPSMATTEGKIAFAREMFAAEAARRKAEGGSSPGIDVDAIMFGDSTFESGDRNHWFRSGSIKSASEFLTRTGFTKGGHIKGAALEMLAREGDAGMRRMERLGISRQAFQAMGMADRTGYATKYTALAAMGDPFAASVMYAGFNQMSPQLKQSLVTSGLSPMFDMSSGDQIFRSSMDGAIYRTQSMEMTSGSLGYGQTPTFGMVNSYASIVQPDQSAMSESQYLKLAETNVGKITEYWNQQSSMSPMASRVNMSAADKNRVSRSMAGLTNSVMVNGQKTYIAGPQSLQMDANRAAIQSQLASAGASYGNLVAQREYELAIERPDALYQLNQQYASFFGGVVASPFSKTKRAARESGDLDQDLGGGSPNQLNFGRGQYEYQRMGMNIQRRDMEANFAQNMTRMGWQQADLYKERKRTLVRADWQREDFALQREQMMIGRDMQSYSYAFQAREMGIGQQQYREDYAYNKRMRQMQFGWQMEDADTNIRRATGFERRQLIKNKERETIVFNAETQQNERVNKRQEEAFKREEERFKKEIDHYKKSIALEDEQYKRSVKRFEQEQEWQEQDFNTQKDRLDQERAWAEESYARQIERFNLEMEQFELQKNNQQVMFEDQMVKQQAAFELSDRTHKNNLAAAGAAANAAKLAAEAQDHMERAGVVVEKMTLALQKFSEGVKWEEVSKAMDRIIEMYKAINPAINPSNISPPASPPPGQQQHANGGYVDHRRSTLVGERGPEIITVDKHGKPFVLPNSAIPRNRQSSGSDQVIHIHVMMDSDEIATYTAGKANTLAARNRRRAFNG